jgi:hypothetical protein
MANQPQPRKRKKQEVGIILYFMYNESLEPGAGESSSPLHNTQVRRPVFQRLFWDLGPGHIPDISLEKYKAVIKLLVAATAGCQGAKN